MSNPGPQRNLFDALLRVLNYVSVLAIFFTAVWIFADVFGRFFLRSPIPGTTELIKSVLLAIVFFGVPYTLRVDGHIRTSILLRRFSPGLRTAAEIFGAGLGAAIFSLVCIYGWEAAVKAWEVLEFEGVQLRVPTYPSRFVMVVGSALLMIQYLLNIAAALHRSRQQPGNGDKA